MTDRTRSKMYLGPAYPLGSLTMPDSLSTVYWYWSTIHPRAERPLTMYLNASSGMLEMVTRSL